MSRSKKKKKVFLDKLRDIDYIAKAISLTDEEKARKAEIYSNLERSTLLEEVSRRHKSRTLWMREGDKSTRFFHRVANSNRRNNLVDSLIVDGYVSSNSKEIWEHILQFYTRLYSDQFSWSPKLDGLHFNYIDVEEATWLERDLRKVKSSRW